MQDPIAGGARHRRGQRSWWRNVYNHISQTSPDGDQIEKEPLKQRTFSRLSSRRHRTSRNTELKDVSRNIDDQPPQSMLRPLKVHHSRAMDEETRFQAQDNIRDGQSINENCLALHHHHTLESDLFIDSPVSSGHRASRSSPAASRLPSPKLLTPMDGLPRPLTYDDPYLFNVPIRPPVDPNQGNQFLLSMAGRQEGTSTGPSGNTLAIPAPLDPHNPSRSKHSQYSWSPPVPTKFTPSPGISDAQRKPKTHRPRSSIHRREPAGQSQDIETQHQDRAFPPSSRIRFSGIPFDSINPDRNISKNTDYS